MISLQPINEDNYREALELKVTEEQAKFVATNMKSMAQAGAIRHLKPCAIMKDDEMVGFLMYTIEDQDYPNHACLWRLMIAPDHQHKGYGREALNLLINELKKNEALDGLSTSHVPNNVNAAKLYEKVGMQNNGDIHGKEIVFIITWRNRK